MIYTASEITEASGLGRVDIDMTPLETVTFEYTNSEGETVTIHKAFDGGAHLEEVADLVRRFLVAAGFEYVTAVTVAADKTEYTATGTF